jgi:hypothetical protein
MHGASAVVFDEPTEPTSHPAEPDGTPSTPQPAPRV